MICINLYFVWIKYKLDYIKILLSQEYDNI